MQKLKQIIVESFSNTNEELNKYNLFWIILEPKDKRTIKEDRLRISKQISNATISNIGFNKQYIGIWCKADRVDLYINELKKIELKKSYDVYVITDAQFGKMVINSNETIIPFTQKQLKEKITI